MPKKKSRKNKLGFNFDYTLLFVLVFIIGFGLVMIYSTSSYSAQMDNLEPEYYFKRQLLFNSVGFIGMLLVARFFDYHHIKKIAKILLIFSILLLFLLKTPLGMTLNGATRWIRIPLVGSLQPAEVVKIGVIVYMAVWINKLGTNFKGLKTLAVVFVIAALVPAAFVMLLSSNLSSALIVAGIGFIMVFVAYPDYKVFVAISGVAAAGVFGIYTYAKNMLLSGQMGSNFRMNRIMVWIKPENYMQGQGYQTVQALYAIGSGGITGKGLGKSLQKLGYIPESQNDMIFSVICEELGLLGAGVVIVLFMVMLWRLVHIAQNAPDLLGSLITTGVFAHIAIQVVLNIAVVTNTIPNTGVSLPFISYGGTSAVFLLMELGLVFNISSQSRLEK